MILCHRKREKNKKSFNKMRVFSRSFGRANRRGSKSARQRLSESKKTNTGARDYAKRPVLAPHVINGAGGGYNRNAHRIDDDVRYLMKRRRVLYASPILLFAAVAAITLWAPFSGRPQELSAQQASAISRDAQPDVVPFAGASDERQAENYLETYQVASMRPRILTIESLGIRARVFEVGTDGRGQPQLAKNSYDTGWYNVSALPGEAGAVVLSGACSGSVNNGVFNRLGELSSGAQITLQRGDGVTVVYTVVSVDKVAVESVDMTTVLRPSYGATRGLNLIGCTGSYNTKTNDFAGRTIVYAIQEDK